MGGKQSRSSQHARHQRLPWQPVDNTATGDGNHGDAATGCCHDDDGTAGVLDRQTSRKKLLGRLPRRRGRRKPHNHVLDRLEDGAGLQPNGDTASVNDIGSSGGGVWSKLISHVTRKVQAATARGRQHGRQRRHRHRQLSNTTSGLFVFLFNTSIRRCNRSTKNIINMEVCRLST